LGDLLVVLGNVADTSVEPVGKSTKSVARNNGVVGGAGGVARSVLGAGREEVPVRNDRSGCRGGGGQAGGVVDLAAAVTRDGEDLADGDEVGVGDADPMLV
jgi:hypothetical protein